MLSKIYRRVIPSISLNDLFVLFSVSCAPPLIWAVLWIRNHKNQPVGLLSDVPVLIAITLSLLEAIPYWRGKSHSALLFGYAAVMGGLPIGFFCVELWVFGTTIDGDYRLAQPITDLAVGLWANEVSYILVSSAAGGIAVQSAINGYLHLPKKKTLFQLLIENRYDLLIALLSGATIVYCVSQAIFISIPNIPKHTELLGFILEAPYGSSKSLHLMSSLMIAGALVSWLAIIYHRKNCNCCITALLTVALTAVLISHVLCTIAGISGLAFLSWTIYRQRAIWMIFCLSSCLLGLVTGLHVSIHYSSSSDQQESSSVSFI